MNLSLDLKKSLIVAGAGAALFLLIKKVFPVSKPVEAGSPAATSSAVSASASAAKVITSTPQQQKDALVLVTAYSKAEADGKPSSFLAEMNNEFMKEYKMKVMKNASTGVYFVIDAEGKQI